MSRQICRVGLISLVIFGLFMGNSVMFASMPPHPRISKEAIKNSYFLQNRNELLKRGLNAPWASPEIRDRSLNSRSGIERSLGPSKAPSGSWRALVILVQFTDKANTVTAGYFDNLIFGTSTGTVRDYYGEISYGTLDIVTVNMPSSIGWTLAPQTYAYYVAGNNGVGSYPQNSQKLVEDIVNAVDGSIDFSQYDNDGDGSVDALFIVHTGPGAEFTGNNNDIWSHAWFTSTPQLLDGVTVYHYSIEPEYWQTSGDMTCGVFAHELGHAGFGLPDLYDRDYSSEGLGNWSLMAGGSWNGPSHLGGSPAYPDAWTHFQMGYLNPTNIVVPLINQPINNVESTPEAYRMWTNGSIGNQYYLVQNRQLTGYDAYLPNSGIFIYHVDETVSTQNDNEWYPGYTSYGHYLVALEQADGLYDLEKGYNRGNTGDPYPGSTLNYNFSSSTTPNSNNYSGTSTSVSVKNISGSASIMTADLQVGIIPGKPLIIENPDTIKFGTVSIGYNRYDTIFVENGGAEPLIVSNIISTLPQYTPSPTNFTITAGTIQPVVVTFAPTDTVAYNGTLTITNNDTAQATVHVALIGKGEYPPAITVIPDSFSVVLVQNDSTERTLTIGNTGTGSLRWSVSSSYVSGGNRVQESASSLKSHIITRKDNAKNGSIFGKKGFDYGQTPIEAVKVYSSPGLAPSGGKDIAILGADGSGGLYLADVANYFVTSGKFNSVTTINGFSVIPTLTELQAYNAVVVFGWYYWVDNGAIGDLLADYVDAGGNVLIALAANATGGSWMVGGRFDSDNYWLMTPNPGYAGMASSMGTVLFPGHPIMSGISTVQAYAKLNNDATVASTATCLANFTDGTPLIAIDESRLGRRVDISYPVHTISLDPAGIDTTSNADELIVNATEWLSAGGKWLTYTPGSGVLVPGATQDVTIKFNAKDLQGGDYHSIISITSNDPVSNPKNVPANLHVIGIPIISAVPDTLDIGTIFVNTEKFDSIEVRNIGSDVLNVTNINSSLPVFTPGVTNFSLSPNRGQNVTIRFAPVDTGTYIGTLSISSNDSINPVMQAVLIGRGVFAPVISVAPDSFMVELVQNDSTERTMIIGNTDQGVLDWEIQSNVSDSITTTFTGGNGAEGNMFDVTAINTITSSGFDIHLEANTDIEIYYKSGTYVGFENNSGAWTLAAAFPGVIGRLFGTPTPLPHTLSITIPAGQTYAFYITSANPLVGLTYTNGTAVGQVYVSDENLQVKEGCGIAYPFLSYFTPRIWNGKIHYTANETTFWSVLPSSGTVAPSSNQNVTVKFSAKDLVGGNYRSIIPVRSNDPATGLVNIPANLHVIGVPIISFSPDSIDAGLVFIGMSRTDTVKIKNEGSDVLNITDITSNLPEFTVGITSFSLLPDSERVVTVQFTPSDTGVYNGLLTLSSNDVIHPTAEIPLHGRGIYPPTIAVSPDSFSVTLASGDSTTRTMTITNTGLGPLLWSINTTPQGVNTAYLKYVEELKSLPVVIKGKGEEEQSGPDVNFSSGGPDSAGYRWIDSDQSGGPAFNWTDIKGTGTLISMSGDDYNTGPFPIGFNFNFYGNTFSTFKICTNGWISFTSSLSSYSNYQLPNTSAPLNMIAAFWDDLSFPSNRAYYYYDGSKLTIQYDSVQVLGVSASVLTFQIILYPSGDIKLQYSRLVNATLNSSTVGIQNQNGTIGLTVVYNAAYLKNNLAILISKNSNFLSFSQLSGIIEVGQQQDVEIEFNARGLVPGNYRSNISITSNDPVNGIRTIPAYLTVTVGPQIVSDDIMIIPKEFALRQNYPNPFNPSTTIKFDIPKSTHVTLSIYNILGAQVTTLVDEDCLAGSYTVQWNGQARSGSVASGIYFTVIRAGDFRKTVKMILMK